MTNYDHLPLKAKLDSYAQQHTPVGGFLTALLTNNLFGAFGAADDTNVKLIHDYIRYIYNELPGKCWGNPEKVRAWLAMYNPGNDRG